jgi:hypothetical protein
VGLRLEPKEGPREGLRLEERDLERDQERTEGTEKEHSRRSMHVAIQSGIKRDRKELSSCQK